MLTALRSRCHCAASRDGRRLGVVDGPFNAARQLMACLIGAGLWGAATLAVTDAHAQGMPDSVRSVVMRIAILQASAELGTEVAHRAQSMPEWGANADSLRTLHGAFAVWRATLWAVSHVRPFLVVTGGGTAYRLGGFPDPDIRLFSRAVPVSIGGYPDARSHALELATLLDPNGAVDIVSVCSPAGDRDNLLAARWQRLAPETWPQDTAFLRPDGAFEVRVSVLSQAAWLPRPAWQPIAYAFFLSKTGEVLAWHAREGPSLESLMR
jgi:hypothetical protein